MSPRELTPLLLTGAHPNGPIRTLARLVYVNADGRNVWDDDGPDLLVEGIDCEVVREDTDDA